MNTKNYLYSMIESGIPKSISEGLDEELDRIHLDKIRAICDRFRDLFSDKKLREKRQEFVDFLEQIDTLLSYEKIISKGLYINEYKDKYGNKYLQARTSIKVKGKTKWVAAYLGSKEQYPKGINDPIALKNGKHLILEKLLKLGVDNFS
jgi:hypothetical protein